jgi:hypothetical protein
MHTASTRIFRGRTGERRCRSADSTDKVIWNKKAPTRMGIVTFGSPHAYDRASYGLRGLDQQSVRSEHSIGAPSNPGRSVNSRKAPGNVASSWSYKKAFDLIVGCFNLPVVLWLSCSRGILLLLPLCVKCGKSFDALCALYGARWRFLFATIVACVKAFARLTGAQQRRRVVLSTLDVIGM